VPDAAPVALPSMSPSPDPALFDKVVNLCKRRGFVYPSAEIYGGFRSAYDYGPVGVLLLKNVQEAWWRSMVQLRDDVVGLDAAIIMSPKVWEASGHLEVFTDPLVECLNCHQRFRADHLPGIHAPQSGHEEDETTIDMQNGLLTVVYYGSGDSAETITVRYEDQACRDNPTLHDLIEHVVSTANEDIATECADLKERLATGNFTARGHTLDPAAVVAYIERWC